MAKGKKRGEYPLKEIEKFSDELREPLLKASKDKEDESLHGGARSSDTGSYVPPSLITSVEGYLSELHEVYEQLKQGDIQGQFTSELENFAALLSRVEESQTASIVPKLVQDFFNATQREVRPYNPQRVIFWHEVRKLVNERFRFEQETPLQAAAAVNSTGCFLTKMAAKQQVVLDEKTKAPTVLYSHYLDTIQQVKKDLLHQFARSGSTTLFLQEIGKLETLEQEIKAADDTADIKEIIRGFFKKNELDSTERSWVRINLWQGVRAVMNRELYFLPDDGASQGAIEVLSRYQSGKIKNHELTIDRYTREVIEEQWKSLEQTIAERATSESPAPKQGKSDGLSLN